MVLACGSSYYCEPSLISNFQVLIISTLSGTGLSKLIAFLLTRSLEVCLLGMIMWTQVGSALHCLLLVSGERDIFLCLGHLERVLAT